MLCCVGLAACDGAGSRSDTSGGELVRAGSASGTQAPRDDERIVNGGFEREPIVPGSAQRFSAIPGWATSSGPGLELQNQVAGASFEGTQHVELDSDAPSAIYQDVSTMPGASYDLSFAYAPRPGVTAASNRIEVLFAGRRVVSVTAAGDAQSDTRWVRVVVSVQAFGAVSRLELRDVGAADGLGGYLDAISLRASGTAAPRTTPIGVAVPASITNGGFEQPAIGAGSVQSFPSVPGWGLASGAGIEVQNQVAGTPFEGTQLVELDSDGSSAIYQDVITQPGGRYDLGLAYSPRPGVTDNGVEAWLGGRRVASFDAAGDGLGDTLWYQVVVRVQALAASSRLELRDRGPSDSVGGYVDAVSMQPAIE